MRESGASDLHIGDGCFPMLRLQGVLEPARHRVLAREVVLVGEMRDVGVDVVFLVIGWQDDGSFRIEPAAAFPPGNVNVPTDCILLEGARSLDEKRAGR